MNVYRLKAAHGAATVVCRGAAFALLLIMLAGCVSGGGRDEGSLNSSLPPSGQEPAGQQGDAASGLAEAKLLADIDNADEFLAALAGGVAGFCRSDASVDAIVRTIQSVQVSGVAIPRDMVIPLVAQVRHGRGHRMNTVAGPIDVTDREWEIMQLMLQRLTTREIASALYV